MQLAYVAAVFMMAGILFPIVLVLTAVVIDSTIAGVVVLWWSWKHRHDPSVSRYFGRFAQFRGSH
ncbi:MAG TPA: hypothetical protein VFJ74_17610 [Gemmatimonadaceae bacterium]|nr:hypothetical protein [Gemmatimonadaceae bacterium]